MAQDVSIRDADVPFMRLVLIMVKLMFASIPAIIIFWTIMSLLFGLVAWIGGDTLLDFLV